ncbi:MAG: hypothetical protein WKF91_10730 [Segetibacter sp.]|jgi:uncharacterized membrane protein YkvI
MIKNSLIALLLLSVTTTLAGCEMFGEVFKAGMWIGVIVVVAVVALVLWLLRKMRR